MASDGVWEFLSNNQVMDIVEKFYKFNDLQGAAERIVQEATKCWQRVYKILSLGGSSH